MNDIKIYCKKYILLYLMNYYIGFNKILCNKEKFFYI